MSGQKSIMVLACALVWIGAAETARGQTTYYVNGTCCDDTWLGTSPVCQSPDGPVCTIQDGIDLATGMVGDQVEVADGVYILTAEINLNKEVTVRSKNGSGFCTIDCNNVSRAFLVNNNVGNAAVIQGFEIKNGSADRGGAIRCGTDASNTGSPTIRGNNIHHNNATDFGGGIYVQSPSAPYIVDNEVHFNTAETGAGGIYWPTSGGPPIRDCNIHSN